MTGCMTLFTNKIASLQKLLMHSPVGLEPCGIIGPYLFKDDGGHNVTVNGAVFAEHLVWRFGLDFEFDLTPLHYFLWGNAKSLVFTDKPASVASFAANIVRGEILAEMCENVAQYCICRMDHLKCSRGHHLSEQIFKKKMVSKVVYKSNKNFIEKFFFTFKNNTLKKSACDIDIFEIY